MLHSLSESDAFRTGETFAAGKCFYDFLDYLKRVVLCLGIEETCLLAFHRTEEAPVEGCDGTG